MSDERDSQGARGTIRRLQADDAPAAWELLRAAPQAAEWSEDSIRNSLADNNSVALGIVSNEVLVGCIFGVEVAGEAEILNLAVTPSHRRSGLARQLVTALLTEWQKQSVRRVFLEVRESNAGAIKLYQGLGFKKFGRRKNYYSAPIEDALVLDRQHFE